MGPHCTTPLCYDGCRLLKEVRRSQHLRTAPGKEIFSLQECIAAAASQTLTKVRIFKHDPVVHFLYYGRKAITYAQMR